VVELRGVAAAGADDAVDVGEVVKGDQALDLAAIPGVVLGVQPDGIETSLGGVRGHHGAGIVHAGDARSFALAKTGAEEGGTHERLG
jgi:hypothetical protein